MTALTELSDGTSLSERWRDVLQEADTVTEADIRNVYPGSADTGGGRLSAPARLRRSQLSWHMRGPMPRPRWPRLRLRSLDKIDTVAAAKQCFRHGAATSDLAGNLSQGQLLATALAQMEAIERIGSRRRGAYNAEVARREAEARRLVDRAALEAQWAEERATLAAAADQRIQSMYGGFQIPAGLGGN